jgi:hypothetical protein
VDAELWSEFQAFMAVRGNLGAVVGTAYYRRCLAEDIRPCFTDAGITAHVDELLALMAANDLVMESLPAPEQGPCFLSGADEMLMYRIKAAKEHSSDSPLGQWQRISGAAYVRMVAVAELHTYLRHLAKGIVRTAEDEVYAELVRHRLLIACARLGWHGPLPL